MSIIEMISKMIKEARKEMEMTQEQFAELCDISLNSLKRYESGTGVPLFSTCKKIDKAINKIDL